MVVYLLAVQFTACVQTHSLVRRADAFYTIRLPGNIAVDENGNRLPARIDTITVIYLETTTKHISWDTAWTVGKTYRIIAEPIVQTPFEAGISKQGRQKIILRPIKRNYLWQLQLLLFEQNSASPQPIRKDQIIFRGRYKGKTIIKKTDELVELKAIPSV